jgi:tetratricopeptide (TPR) repeat protein
LAAKRPSTPRPTPWRKHAFFIAALWIAALVAYSNSFHAGLAFDSQRVILADSRIQADTPENAHQIWTGDYYNGTGSSALYRPLTTLTYLWNYAVLGDGPNAAGYHAVNFVLHALNIALVYLLGLAVFGEMWPAFAMSMLWALHPILTESVTNVAGRADLLAAFGVLAGLLCYVRSERRTAPSSSEPRPRGSGALTGRWRSWAWTAALAAAAAIALFSKESGIVLIAAMVAYDVAFWGHGRDRLAPKLAGYIAVLIPAAIWFAMRRTALAQVSSLLISYGDNPLQGAGFWVSRLTALKVLGAYLWLLIWPARLSPDYSYNQIPLSNGTDFQTILALLVWIAIAAAAVISYRRARPVLFFIAFFAVAIAPVANLVILVGSIMAERFLYLPSVGFAGELVWGALVLRRRVPSKWLAAALAVVCLAFAARTWARNADWFDDRTLWANAVQVCPNSYKTHQNLAMLALAQPQPDYPTATREVERALAILDPLPDGRSMPGVYATAGQCYRARGDLGRALQVLLRGRNVDHAWNAAFQERNRVDGKTVTAVGTPPLYLELGRVYLDLGQPEKALETFREGRSIDPQPPFFEEMSRAYNGMRQPGAGAISLLEGLAVYAGRSDLVKELTQLYQATAPETCALNRAAAGVTVNLNCPLVHDQLCTASHNMVEMFTAMRDPSSAGAIAQNAAQNYGCPR